MLGRVLVVVWFVVGGIGHFVLTNTFTSVVPFWVPFPREWGANGFARVSNAGVLEGLKDDPATWSRPRPVESPATDG